MYTNVYSIDPHTGHIYIKEYWSGELWKINLKTLKEEKTSFPTSLTHKNSYDCITGFTTISETNQVYYGIHTSSTVNSNAHGNLQFFNGWFQT